MKTLGITHSVCDTCRRAGARQGDRATAADVYFEKFCPEHGASRNLVRRDVDDYLRTLRYVKPAWVPRAVRRRRGGRLPRRLRLLLAARAAPVHADRRDHVALRPGVPGVPGRCRPAVGHDAGGVRPDAGSAAGRRAADRHAEFLRRRAADAPGAAGLVDEALSRPGNRAGEHLDQRLGAAAPAGVARPAAASGTSSFRCSSTGSGRRSTRRCAAGRCWPRSCGSSTCCASRASRRR